MGQILFEQNELSLAKIAFKKMLQLSWLIRSTDWEFRAYNEIGKAYFYMGHIEKSNDYQMKALNGDLEELDSRQRTISEDQYRKKVKQESKQGMNKYIRAGYKLTRSEQCKTIDGRQDFSKMIEAIRVQKILSSQTSDNDSHLSKESNLAKKMVNLCSRRIGNKLVRHGTPLSKMVTDV